MAHVTLDPSFDNEVLQCPTCGGCNLHQEHLVCGDVADEILIGMRCENWCLVPDLRIRQHKGLTIIEWTDKRAGHTFVNV